MRSQFAEKKTSSGTKPAVPNGAMTGSTSSSSTSKFAPMPENVKSMSAVPVPLPAGYYSFNYNAYSSMTGYSTSCPVSMPFHSHVAPAAEPQTAFIPVTTCAATPQHITQATFLGMSPGTHLASATMNLSLNSSDSQFAASGAPLAVDLNSHLRTNYYQQAGFYVNPAVKSQNHKANPHYNNSLKPPELPKRRSSRRAAKTSAQPYTSPRQQSSRYAHSSASASNTSTHTLYQTPSSIKCAISAQGYSVPRQVKSQPQPHTTSAVTVSSASSTKSSSSVNGETRRPGPNNNGYDDANHDYIITIGEVWDNRYLVVRKLGRGSFGQVVEATDNFTGERVAIKIIKNKGAFTRQAAVEEKIVRFLGERCRNREAIGSDEILKFLRSFTHHSHLCLVYELLGINLYELLRLTNFQGVSLTLVRRYAEQLLRALTLLASQSVRIVHCDLKPENILIKDPSTNAIKIIDFGSSCFENEKAYTYIQSRFYRSPEVLLGLSYGCEIDVWSLGCVLVELLTGEPIFPGKNEGEMVGGIIECLGMDGVGRAVSQALTRGHGGGSKREKVSQWFVPSDIKDKTSSHLCTMTRSLSEDSMSDNELPVGSSESEDELQFKGDAPFSASSRYISHDNRWTCIAPKPSKTRQSRSSTSWGGRERNLWSVIRRKMLDNRSIRSIGSSNSLKSGECLEGDSAISISSSSSSASTQVLGSCRTAPGFLIVGSGKPETRSMGTMTEEDGFVTLNNPVDFADSDCMTILDPPGETASDYKNLYTLLRQMLQFDEKNRITPVDALKERFFRPHQERACQTVGGWYQSRNVKN